MDSDFDVDESQWDEPVDTEVEVIKRKKKEWIKPYKPKVCVHAFACIVWFPFI